MRDAYVGIDVACAKKKRMPIVACTRSDGALRPLDLRSLPAKPPTGEGNLRATDVRSRTKLADAVADYLHEIERTLDVTIRRIAIDAPRLPREESLRRRRCECALEVNCFTTPSACEFEMIRAKVQQHVKAGGSHATLPHANQLWMLVGFALFERLIRECECLEVFPNAIVHALKAASLHKSKAGGIEAQWKAATALTWPGAPPAGTALANAAYGPLHDRLDAYLAAWVASLGESEREALGTLPEDVIWIPRL